MAGKQTNDPAFKMPSRQHSAKLVKRDLDAARRRWIAQATDEKEQRVREASDFLKYVNSRGQYLDFHSLRHTRGVWLVQHHGAGGPQVMEALGVHSYELVKWYTRSGKFVTTDLIEREPDLTPSLISTPENQPKTRTGKTKSLAPSLAQRSGSQRTSANSGEPVDTLSEDDRGAGNDADSSEKRGVLTKNKESGRIPSHPERWQSG